MKEAFWGIGLIMLSIITFVVIGTLSNVTTTNQQDYEYMKSSVEAAMYDARDEVQYRRGICVCTKKTGSPVRFEKVTEYEILMPNEESECDGIDHSKNSESAKYSKDECTYLHGEYVVNPDIFVESLISRFGTIAKNQEEYDITVQDVISYPPKASVRITYYQHFSEAISDSATRPIVNQMDAVLEGNEIKVVPLKGSASVTLSKIDCSDNVVKNATMTLTDISTGRTQTVTSPQTVNLNVGSYTLSDGANKTSFTVDVNDSGKTFNIYIRTMDLKNCPCTK